MIKLLKLILCLSIGLISTGTYGQRRTGEVDGKLIDSLTRKGIPNVNVFIPFTSMGTTTDLNGEFNLKDIPMGEIKLGFRHITYSPKTVSLTISDSKVVYYTTTMSIAIWELEEVVKIVEMANGKWAYSIFKQYFLGDQTETSCYILNPEVLLFHVEANKLIAKTIEPLKIINKHLGYNITYYLDYFEFYYKRGDIDKFYGLQYYSYNGESLFSNIDSSNKRKTQRWEKNRNRLYLGSQRHFYQSLYSDSLEENGFVVKPAWKSIADIEKFYTENDQVYDPQQIILDSLPNYIQGKDEPEYIYFQPSGDPIEIKSTFHQQKDHLVFQMHHPLLVFYGSSTSLDMISNGQISLMHIDDGFIEIDHTGNFTVTDGTLNWKYLKSNIFIRNFLPTDYYPESID